MNRALKLQIGRRVRQKREKAGYTREKLGELCGLSPRFIANVELGDSTFSLDSLMVVCHVLSCSSDYLLFGIAADKDDWSDTVEKLRQMDVKYQKSLDKVIQGFTEAILRAEQGEPL